MRKLTRRLMPLATTLVVFAVFAATASANPVVSVGGGNTLSVAGGSESSTIEVSIASGQYVVTRTNGDLSNGGSPCTLIASNQVSCAFGTSTPSAIDVALGDGTDKATIKSTVPEYVTALITGVYYVVSESSPLDATLDESGSSAVAVGGPMQDTINIQMANACTVDVDAGDGDDHVRIRVGTGTTCSTPSYNSILSGGDGDDMINAEDSKTAFEYAASGGHDIFMGGTGADHITVGDGPDWAFGGGGNDRFYDDAGSDPSKLWGGPGNDTYTDWDYDDIDTTYFDGGSGFDQVAYHLIYDGTNVSVTADGVADDGVYSETDNIHQSVEGIGSDGTYNNSGQFRGDDYLVGSNGPSVIYGRNGADEIHGEGGDDQLYGGAGNDIFYCGDGYDIVYDSTINYVDADCEEVQ